MPWHDIQFWLVSAVALWGFWVLGRQVLPKKGDSGTACGSCASGAAAKKRAPNNGLVQLGSRGSKP